MPRIRQNEEKYAVADFQSAVFVAMVKKGMECSVRKLAGRIGVSQSSLNNNLRHTPQNLSVGTLRKIVQTVGPDIRAVLILLGYSSQDIKKFKEEAS